MIKAYYVWRDRMYEENYDYRVQWAVGNCNK